MYFFYADTSTHNRDSSWCDAGNLIIRQNCATWHYRSYIRPTQIFLAPFWVVAWDICRKGSNWLYLFYLKQTVAKNGWVYVSAYDYLLTIIFFLPACCDVFLIIVDWRMRGLQKLQSFAAIWGFQLKKWATIFFVAKGAHHIEVASKYYTYSGESNKKKTATFCFVSCPPRPHRALLHACSS